MLLLLLLLSTTGEGGVVVGGGVEAVGLIVIGLAARVEEGRMFLETGGGVVGVTILLSLPLLLLEEEEEVVVEVFCFGKGRAENADEEDIAAEAEGVEPLLPLLLLPTTLLTDGSALGGLACELGCTILATPNKVTSVH
jgi:hypothetical protein